MNPFTHNITRLFVFKGRQNRQPFWLWVLIVYGVQTVLTFLVAIALMVSLFGRLESLMPVGPANSKPSPEAMQAIVMQAMMPMMSGMMWVSVAMGVMFALLLAAATTRRLHDGNRTGWWSAPVFALQVLLPMVYVGYVPQMMAAFDRIKPGMTPDQIKAAMAPMAQGMNWLSVASMFNLLLMIGLLILLVLPGTVGPNRFGDDPLGGLDLPPFEPSPR